MSAQEILVVGAPLVAWVVAMSLASSRTWRAIAFLTVWTCVWFTAALAAPSIATPARALLAGLLVFAIASPSKLGIGALSSKERQIDARIRDGTFSGADSPLDLERELAWIEGLLPGDRRRHLAVRLKVWARTRGDAALLGSPTPSRYFDWAGNAFLKDAEWQRVLGVGETRANAWDESIALRCFYEEAQGHLPKEAGGPEPLVLVGDWEPAVRRVMGDLQDAPLRDPIMARLRDHLVAAIDARRALALGPLSEEVTRRQAESSAVMNEGWREAQRHVAELGLVRESPST